MRALMTRFCNAATAACGTRTPAQCPARALPSGTSLEQAPSLHPLRGRVLGVVRGLHWYYAPVRLLAPVHRRLRLLAFPTRTLGHVAIGQMRDLPGSGAFPSCVVG